jgi:hypothetical protein
MPQIIAEAGAVTKGTGSRLRIQIINEGQGSSGFYPADVLEQAATDKVFKAGTLMFADHPTESEDWQRPERSIKDLAGVLATDAVFEDGALIAEANIFTHWREPINDMKDTIGVSIRAGAEVAIEDNGGGPVQVIKRLTHAASVDFVTMAGRGGSILEVLESARDFDIVTTKDSPSAPAGVTENEKEPIVATIQIEESVHADLVAQSSRTTALEAELSEARTKLAAAESATATAQAESIVAEAFGDIEAKATRRSLVKAALAAESFDAEALKADAVEAAAEIRAERGEGQPRGVGYTGSATESADPADADVLTALKGA